VTPVGASVAVPTAWERRGLILARRRDGWGSMVIGDPCIVRDEEHDLWRMFLFALPPGHGQALCEGDPLDAEAWTFAGPLDFLNPEVLPDRGAYKPFVVLDAARPGHAARIDGRYALLVVTDHRAKKVWRAWSASLAGPWTFEDRVLLDTGSAGEFDEKHVDAVSAYHFAERGEILYFYMGYPREAQLRAVSPYGSAQGLAVETVGSGVATKQGVLLEPEQTPGHWASGWVGGLQIFRGSPHRWIGLANASPTAPVPGDESLTGEEPAPSLGGFAFCDEEIPARGWHWCAQPIEWLEDIPAAAIAAGESTNLWRHHALVLEDGRLAVFYNAGPYFEEQLFARISVGGA
jgi:hypothetical protein